MNMNKMYRMPPLFMLVGLIWILLLFILLPLGWEGLSVSISLFILGSQSFDLSFMMDSVSLMFSSVVMFISFSVFLFACSYMKEDLHQFRFLLLLFFFVLSMNILIFASSLLSLLLGWDGLGITSFALIIYYENSVSLKSGFLTLMTNRLGDVFIICTIPMLVAHMSFTMYVSFSGSVLFILLIFAAMTKSAQYPFSAWLPAAMAAPTPVSALVHSSTLVTAGVYLIFRLSLLNPLPVEVCQMLSFCGSLTCIGGGLYAIKENDLKKIIAFSTLSQLGLMVFCLSLNQPMMTLLHLFTHAMFKSLLFLSAGLVLIMGYGNQDIRNLGSVLMTSPTILVYFNISSLCLMGGPFLSSFYSKHVIYELLSMSTTSVLSYIFMLGAMFTTSMYSVRTLKVLSWGKVLSSPVNTKLSPSTLHPLFLLFIFSVSSGKMMSLTILSFNETCFTSVSSQGTLWMFMLLGIVSGLMSRNRKSSNSINSMMFLWPASFSLPMFLTPLSKHMKSLDYGWLEPRWIYQSRIYWKFMQYLQHTSTGLGNKWLFDFLPSLLIVCVIIYINQWF